MEVRCVWELILWSGVLSSEASAAESVTGVYTVGHVRRLQGTVPAHEALRLVVNTRTGHRPDVRPEWKRPRGRPRHRPTWIRQLEVDVGLTAK